jgi:hypothetical protein
LEVIGMPRALHFRPLNEVRLRLLQSNRTHFTQTALGALIISLAGCGDGSVSQSVTQDVLAKQLADSEKRVEARVAESTAALTKSFESLQAELRELRSESVSSVAASNAQFRALGSEITQANQRSGVVANSMESLQALAASRDDESGRKARAASASQLAEAAVAAGRRDDAVLLATSAAVSDPTNPRLAALLAEIVLEQSGESPEALASTAAVLRSIALQSSGEGILAAWRLAEQLEARQLQATTRLADEESKRVLAEASEAAKADVARANALILINFAESDEATREDLFLELASLTERLDEANAETRALCVQALERWQRVREFLSTLSVTTRVLNSIEASVGQGQGGDDLVYGQLTTVEPLLRTFFLASQTEVGPSNWQSARTQVERLKSVAESVFQARDKVVLDELTALVTAIDRGATDTRARLGKAIAKAGTYESALKDAQRKGAAVTKLASRLLAESSAAPSLAEVERLQKAIVRLREAQYESYCAWVERKIQAAWTAFSAEMPCTHDDAIKIARTVMEIDSGDLPTALREAYGFLWATLEGEMDPKSLAQAERVRTAKVTPSDF